MGPENTSSRWVCLCVSWEVAWLIMGPENTSRRWVCLCVSWEVAWLIMRPENTSREWVCLCVSWEVAWLIMGPENTFREWVCAYAFWEVGCLTDVPSLWVQTSFPYHLNWVAYFFSEEEFKGHFRVSQYKVWCQSSLSWTLHNNSFSLGTFTCHVCWSVEFLLNVISILISLFLL